MPVRRVTHHHTIWPALTGLLRNSLRQGPAFRRHVARELWDTTKRYGARGIRNVELLQLQGSSGAAALENILVDGYIDMYDGSRQIVAALCSLLECQTFFEIGTYHGKTTRTVARTNPGTSLFTLDLPSKEVAARTGLEFTDAHLLSWWDTGRDFVDTPDARRIQQLFGDTATFDFSPYYNTMDMVYIEGSHSYSYVKNDTEAAMKLLSPTGTIIWDDYPRYPGVYIYLTELAEQLEGALLHIVGTRLALYSRQALLRY